MTPEQAIAAMCRRLWAWLTAPDREVQQANAELVAAARKYAATVQEAVRRDS